MPLQRPFGSFFHATGAIGFDPQKGIYHFWQSRAHRKRSPHAAKYIQEGKPWWSYLFSWKPTSFAWWTAFSFTFGSVIFVVVAAIAIAVQNASEQLDLFLGNFALVGALIFVVGGTCQVLETYQAPITIVDSEVFPSIKTVIAQAPMFAGFIAEPYLAKGNEIHSRSKLAKAISREQEAKEARGKTGFDIIFDKNLSTKTRLIMIFGQWRRIDVSLAWIQWVGTLLFVVNSVGTSGVSSTTGGPSPNYGRFLAVTVVPDIVASITFVIAGWLQMVESSHKWYGGVAFSNIGWEAGVNNTLGGLGFLGNAVAYYLLPSSFVSNLILLIGSAFFLIGSAIAWVEQCF